MRNIVLAVAVPVVLIFGFFSLSDGWDSYHAPSTQMQELRQSEAATSLPKAHYRSENDGGCMSDFGGINKRCEHTVYVGYDEDTVSYDHATTALSQAGWNVQYESHDDTAWRSMRLTKDDMCADINVNSPVASEPLTEITFMTTDGWTCLS